MYYFLTALASVDDAIPKPFLPHGQTPWIKSDFFRWAIIIFILALLVFTIRRAFKSEVEITNEKPR